MNNNNIDLNNTIEVSFDFGGLEEALKRIAALNDPKKNASVNSALKKGYRKAGAYLIRVGRKKERISINANKAKWPNVKHTGNLLSSFRTKIKRSGLGMLVGFTDKGRHSWLVDHGHGGKRSHNGWTEGSKFWESTRENEAKTAQAMVADAVRQAVYTVLG